MTEEINEIIKKNLPAQVGELLKERLAQAETDGRRVKELEKILEDRKSMIDHLEKTVKNYRALDDRNSKLEARETLVAEKERNQKVAELELKLEESEKRITDNTNFVGMVFKSPIFRKTVSEYAGGYQNYNQQLGRNELIPDGTHNRTEEKSMD